MIHNYSKETLQKTGVYKITCKANSKFYIGSAACVNASSNKLGFLGRLYGHVNHLINNTHRNTILQNSWNKYGKDSFIFEILEFCEKEDCLEREQYYLDTLLPFYPLGFNICRNSLSNIKFTKPKIRAYNRDNSKINNNQRIWVIQKDLNGNYINEYYGIAEAARLTNIHRVSIYKCCRKENKTGAGFIWEYKYPEDFKKSIKIDKFKVKVLNLLNNEIVIYNSIMELSRNIDYCKSTILIHLKNKIPIENKYYLEKIFL